MIFAVHTTWIWLILGAMGIVAFGIGYYRQKRLNHIDEILKDSLEKGFDQKTLEK